MFLGLGANLGRRAHYLERALHEIDKLGQIELVSSLYETEPWGSSDLAENDQADYLNIVIKLHTELAPAPLLERCLEIESLLGRRRPAVRNAARCIDIDLLLYGMRQVKREKDADGPALDLPHPRMLKRAFVLVPLLEIEPKLRDPISGACLRDFLPAVEDQSLRRCKSRLRPKQD